MVRKKLDEVPADVHDFIIRESILKTLLYFDIFNYPLNADEILHFLPVRSSEDRIGVALDTLVQKGLIFQFNEFYSVQNSIDNVVRRIKGNEFAASMIPVAKRQAQLIGRFPFVRAVMASGSISKGYMDENSDLDFFIVTDPGRLWVARMLLVLYKRIVLFNSHKYFCVNYFITSDHLEIEEKNRFTATELATVIPLYGQPLYRELQSQNGWVMRFFPNYVPRSATLTQEKNNFTKGLFEKMIGLLGADRLDNLCLKATYKRWVALYKTNYTEADFKVAFKSNKGSSKNHPRNYQRTIIEKLEEKWLLFKAQHNVEDL